MTETAVKSPATKSEPKEIDRFWIYEFADGTKEVKSVKIDHKKYIDFLRQKGFRRYDLDNDYFFVRILNNVIDQVQIPYMQDFILRYIQNFEEDLIDNFIKWKEQIL